MKKSILIILLEALVLFAQNEESEDMFEFKRFLILPIGAYSEQTGIILGAGSMFFIEPPAADGSTAGCNYAFALMTSLKKQATITNRFTFEPNSHWNLLVHLFFQTWPTQYFGKGNDLDEGIYAVYTAKNARLPLSLRTDLFLPQTMQGLFSYGVEFDAEYITFSHNENFTEFYGSDLKKSRRLGLGYNLTYNSSEKNDWPRKGSFVQFRHIFFNSQSSFEWKNLDTRMYIPLPFLPEGVFALGSYLESFTGEVPIDRLAMPDGVGQLRGLKKGLLADKVSWVLQSELRTHLFWRCKGTLFYEAAKVGNDIAELNENKWHRAIGIGGRFLVNKNSKTHIRGDLSLIDKKVWGMAIKINEAF